MRRLLAILATAAILAGCSAEILGQPGPEPNQTQVTAARVCGELSEQLAAAIAGHGDQIFFRRQSPVPILWREYNSRCMPGGGPALPGESAY